MDNYNINADSKTIKLWINGWKPDYIIKIKINTSINSLKRLKDTISNNLKEYKITNLKIYNHKGLEIDNADIDNLANNQVLYVSLEGENFNFINYIYEYEFIKWIKSGGYGSVFFARNVINNQDYAIKKIDISNLKNDEIYNIYREALYLESFKHKNIIKFYHSFIYENNFYTVMDLARGGELSKYVNDQKCLSERTTKKLFKQIHQAVSYIHSKNVIHRDLKPNNIMFLDENKENLIIDFGISGFHSGNIKEIIKAGTTRFIPPELASGTNFISNPKIDSWALGVILYLMLFGIFPFDGTESEIIFKIIKEGHKFPKSISVSKACKCLINGLLEKNSQYRIDTHDKLFSEWYEDKNDDEFVVINDNIILTPTNSNKIMPSIAKSISNKEGKEPNFMRNSLGNIELMPKFEPMSDKKYIKYSRVLAVEKFSIDCDKKSPEGKERCIRKRTVIEKSPPSIKKSMDFSINLNYNKKISDKLISRISDRFSKK